MSEGAIGFIAFIATCTITAIIGHLFLRRYFIASLISAIVSTVIFQIIIFLHLGYLDPFLPIAVIVSGALALAISLIIGLIKWVFRKTDSPK